MSFWLRPNSCHFRSFERADRDPALGAAVEVAQLHPHALDILIQRVGDSMIAPSGTPLFSSKKFRFQATQPGRP
jgi:hypothetical protein